MLKYPNLFGHLSLLQAYVILKEAVECGFSALVRARQNEEWIASNEIKIAKELIEFSYGELETVRLNHIFMIMRSSSLKELLGIWFYVDIKLIIFCLFVGFLLLHTSTKIRRKLCSSIIGRVFTNVITL